MWPLVSVLDGSIVVSLEQVEAAVRLLANRVRVVAEGAGAAALAAALCSGGRRSGGAVISGGNIDARRVRLDRGGLAAVTGAGPRIILLALALSACAAMSSPIPTGTATAIAGSFAAQSASPSLAATRVRRPPAPADELDGPSPAAGGPHLDACRGREDAYLFGGRDGAGRAFDDLWVYDLAGSVAATRHSRPGGAIRAQRGVGGIGLVIFAGQSPTTFFNDLWAYDPAADRWHGLPAVATRRWRATELRRARSGRPPLDQPRLHQRGLALRRHARLRLHHAGMDR